MRNAKSDLLSTAQSDLRSQGWTKSQVVPGDGWVGALHVDVHQPSCCWFGCVPSKPSPNTLFALGPGHPEVKVQALALETSVQKSKQCGRDLSPLRIMNPFEKLMKSYDSLSKEMHP